MSARRAVLLLIGLAAFVALPSLSACEWRRIAINDPISHDDVAFIMPGATTLDDVVTELGAPDEITGSDELAVFRYHFRSTRTFKVNFAWLLRFWSPFAPPMTMSRGESGTDVFQVTFDPTWVVRGISFSHEAEQVRYNPWLF